METNTDTSLSQRELHRLLGRCRVLPVLTVGDPSEAVALVGALAAGGLTTVEITLRTPEALTAIGTIVRELPGVSVGVGTVVDPDQLRAAEQAGASFAVSPGITADLIAAAAESALPWLPGISTVSEAMVAREAGYDLLKLFPAQAVGGLAFLAAVRGPLPDLRFCPTGGIDEGTYESYLEQPNVVCVGGSWMVRAERVAAADWPAITRQAERISA